MDQTNISWLRAGPASIGAGLWSELTERGLALGAIFVTIWHWVAVLVLFMFGVNPARLDLRRGTLLFVDRAALRKDIGIRRGCRRPNPFTKAETLLAQVDVVGSSMFSAGIKPRSASRKCSTWRHGSSSGESAIFDESSGRPPACPDGRADLRRPSSRRNVGSLRHRTPEPRARARRSRRTPWPLLAPPRKSAQARSSPSERSVKCHSERPSRTWV